MTHHGARSAAFKVSRAFQALYGVCVYVCWGVCICMLGRGGGVEGLWSRLRTCAASCNIIQ
jgi:hypothetical protein